MYSASRSTWPHWSVPSRIRKMEVLFAEPETDGGASSKHGAKAPVQTMPEQAISYVNRPEGEVDMLVGFFLMNGICIAFFLIFGMCVIFSCMRRRPKMFKAQPKEELPPPSPKPSAFRSLVTKAIKTADLKNIETETDVETAKHDTTVSKEGVQLQLHVIKEVTNGRNGRRKSSGKPQLAIEEEVIEVSEENSVIRENLLGPLSFDDLHYT